MTAVLLDKPGHRAADIDADFKGFECPDKFVVATAWTWPTPIASSPL